jgi:hypothetical protein
VPARRRAARCDAGPSRPGLPGGTGVRDALNERTPAPFPPLQGPRCRDLRTSAGGGAADLEGHATAHSLAATAWFVYGTSLSFRTALPDPSRRRAGGGAAGLHHARELGSTTGGNGLG